MRKVGLARVVLSALLFQLPFHFLSQAGEIPEGFLDGNPQAVRKSVMDPHPPKPGPWFEGWYTRVTDADGKRSFAVIVASHLKPGQVYSPGTPLPGYIAVLADPGDGRPLQVIEYFPEETHLWTRGLPVTRDVSLREATDFEWVAEGFGSMTQDRIDLRLGQEFSLQVDLRGRQAWDRTLGNWGPEGYGSFMKFIPLHWFVYSLGSDTSYSLRMPPTTGPEVRMQGSGFAHLEKNWGNAFPTAWIWSEGISANNEARFALAGGNLEKGPFRLHTWLVGYQSEKVQAQFNPGQPDVQYQDAINPCDGTFMLRAKNSEYELIVQARAPLNTYGTVSIPTGDGFKSGARESFRATVEVTVKRNDWLSDFFGEKLIEKRVFTNAALEFGANYRNCTR